MGTLPDDLLSGERHAPMAPTSTTLVIGILTEISDFFPHPSHRPAGFLPLTKTTTRDVSGFLVRVRVSVVRVFEVSGASSKQPGTRVTVRGGPCGAGIRPLNRSTDGPADRRRGLLVQGFRIRSNRYAVPNDGKGAKRYGVCVNLSDT
ncbi:MAG: hypothetical protein AAES65_02340, partial [Candidatus Thiodiazotropha sp. (ex. Lucinoma kazani)]